MTLDQFDPNLLDGLVEVDGFCEFIRPNNSSANEQLADLEGQGLAARNAKGSWYGTDKLREQWKSS